MTNDELDTSYPIKTVDIRRYFYLLWQWLWLIALVAVIAAGTALIVSLRSTSIYQAETQLLVSEPPSVYSGSFATDSIVSSSLAARTYVEMLTDRPVLEQTLAELNITMKIEDFKKAVTVSLLRDTQLLIVTVEDPNPTQAMNIANQLGAVFSKRIQELQGERYVVSKANLQTQISDMETQLSQTSAESAAATDPAEKDRLDTKLTQYRAIYSNLVTSYEQVRLSEAQTNTTVVQVEPASIPLEPVRPRILMNTLLAGLVGLLLAAGGVVTNDALDDTLKDPAELARRTGLPIIGIIPFSEIEEQGPVTSIEPRSPVSESYRGLRTNIAYTAVTRPLRRIIVTSATPGDGKTTIATNLAVILAQSGRQVALIDTDLRRPRIHHVFKLSNRQGLTALFLKQLSLADALQNVGVENLSVIVSGVLPPNPAELLGSERMNQVFKELESDHDMVILDTPPVLSVTDSSVMIPSIDGIIIVVKAGKTHVSATLHAVTTLRRLGANILGLVVNGVRFNDNRFSYYYRSHYYASYYDYAQNYGNNGKSSKGKKNKKSRSVVSGSDPNDRISVPTPTELKSQPDEVEGKFLK